MCLRSSAGASACGMSSVLLMSLMACPGSPVETGHHEDSVYSFNSERTGECSTLDDSWGGWSGAAVNCFELTSLDIAAVDELQTLWGLGPQAICAYDSVYGPPFWANTGCGALQGYNAWACPVDQTIAYDRRFFSDQYQGYGDFAVVTILAHEWGHILQSYIGISYDPSVLTIQKELHADCLAGVFTAFQDERDMLDVGDINEAFASICDQGDPQGLAWYDSAAHGTCPDRTVAFSTGYQLALERLDELCGPDPIAVARQICG